MNRRERYRKCHQWSIKHCQDCSKISRKQKLNGCFNIAIYISSILYCFNNSRKIVICQNHCCSVFWHFASGNSHRHSYVCLFQCRSVIHTISCHGYNVSFFLPCTHNTDLVFRRNSGVNRNPFHKVFQFFIGHFVNLCTLTGFGFIFKNSNSLCNGSSCHLMISCNHNRTDSCTFTLFYSSFWLFSRRIHHCDQPQEYQMIFILQRKFRLIWYFFISKCKNS